MDHCYYCGGHLENKTKGSETIIRGQTIMVDGFPFQKCDDCGEEYYGAGISDAIYQQAVDIYRSKHNLLTGSEIYTIRNSMGLSQAAFEKLLGIGPKTVIRWEKGTVVQNYATDRLMRLLRDLPEAEKLLRDYSSQKASMQASGAAELALQE